MDPLVRLGFGPDLRDALARLGDESREAARVRSTHRGGCDLLGARGEVRATISGKLRREIARGLAPSPVVGDWVAIGGEPQAPVVHDVLPRRTCVVRRAAGARVQEQAIVANVDVLFLATAIGRDFNPRRLERYLAIAHDSGALPVVVLTKADLGDDVAAEIARATELALDAKVHAVSGLTGEGIEALGAYIEPGTTVAIVGSSGVGKSTLVNRWLGEGEQQSTAAVDENERGRHTTTRRELFVLPSGGVLVDTPGMRELGMWDAAEGIGETFAEITEVATRCRFRNCEHAGEPGCAVAEALAAGALSRERVESFRKLHRELAHLARDNDPAARTAHRVQVRKITRALHRRPQEKRGR